jgi:hypothetical protein
MFSKMTKVDFIDEKAKRDPSGKSESSDRAYLSV